MGREGIGLAFGEDVQIIMVSFRNLVEESGVGNGGGRERGGGASDERGRKRKKGREVREGSGERGREGGKGEGGGCQRGERGEEEEGGGGQGGERREGERGGGGERQVVEQKWDAKVRVPWCQSMQGLCRASQGKPRTNWRWPSRVT